MYQHLLVPIDGGAFSAEIISRALAFAKTLEARVTFLHAVPDESVSLRGDAALLHAMAPDRYAAAYTERARAVLAKAEAAAQLQGVPYDAVSEVTNAVSQAILATAARKGCDLIVLSTSGRPGKLPMMMNSVALDVLAQSAIPLLITNFRTAPNPAGRVLGIIKDEHDSLAAVVRGLLHHLNVSRMRGAAPDLALVGAILRYLRAFPQALHHPKEEEHLFRTLRQRTRQLDATIEELLRQHAAEARLLCEADAALAAVERDPGQGWAALDAAAVALGNHVTAHIALEESILLPVACQYLDDFDWEAIDEAFSGNGDPDFAAGCDEDFQVLFARLVSLFPPSAPV